MERFIEHCMALRDSFGANVLYIVSDKDDFIEAFLEAAGDTRCIILTSRGRGSCSIDLEGVEVCEEVVLLADLGILNQLRYFLLRDCVSGMIRSDDKVLCVIFVDLKATILFDVAGSDIVELMKSVQQYIGPDLMEKALDLALDIAREGREGMPVGTLLLFGDTDTVMARCSPHFINPFAGHPSRSRNVHDKRNLETIKQFAMLDGACIFDDDGHAVAAGMYVNTKGGPLEEGTGGRHTAAEAATKGSRAIAILVSSTGTIEVYKDGAVIFDIKYTR